MPTVHWQSMTCKYPNSMDRRKLTGYGVACAIVYMAVYTIGTLIMGDEQLSIRSVLLQGVFFGFFMAMLKKKGWL